MLFVTNSIQLCSEYLTKEALEGFVDIKIGQVIRTVKYADDLCYWLRKKRSYRAWLKD